MEESASADFSTLLQNLQDKISFLEHKASYAKHLVEKTALLTVLTLETKTLVKEQDKVSNLQLKKDDLEEQLVESQDQVTGEVVTGLELLQQREQLLHEVTACIDELQNLDVTILQSQRARDAKQHTIKSLNSEISIQQDLLNELKREKEAQLPQDVTLDQKIEAAENKLRDLIMVNTSAAETLSDVEGSLEHDLKQRCNVKDDKTKAETDLEWVQKGVTDHDHIIKKLERTIKHEIKKLTSVSSKLSDEESLASKLQLQVNELESNIEALKGAIEDDLESRPKKN